jgi:hypothetical protein
MNADDDPLSFLTNDNSLNQENAQTDTTQDDLKEVEQNTKEEKMEKLISEKYDMERLLIALIKRVNIIMGVLKNDNNKITLSVDDRADMTNLSMDDFKLTQDETTTKVKTLVEIMGTNERISQLNYNLIFNALQRS